MNAPSTLLLASLSLLGGCALVYSYGDYKDQGTGGTGGTGASSSKATSTGSHASSSGTGGKAASSSSSSTSSGGGAGGAGGSASSTGTGGMGGSAGSASSSSSIVSSSASSSSSIVSSSASSSSSSSASSSSSSSASSSSSGGCAAPDTCVQVPKTGPWMGPVVLETGSSCPQGWNAIATQVGTAFSVPTACTACACPAPAGGTCPTTAKTVGYSGTGCTGGTYDLSSSTTQSCTPLGQSLGSIKGPPTAATGAMCPGSTTTPMPNAQPAFTAIAMICTGVAGAACGGGSGVCAQPAGPVCFYVSGTASCPLPYPNKTMVYMGIDDGYSCTACACGISAAPTCTPTTRLFSDANTCTSSLQSIPNNGSCVSLGFEVDAYELLNVGSPSGGSCAASGGVLQGSATGSGPITVCCSS